MKQGEIFGFLGANGAGKSTTIRMLCGLLRPTERHGARRRRRRRPRSRRREARASATCRRRFSLYEPLTVDQNIRFFGGIYGLVGRTPRGAPRSSCSRWPASQGRENTLTRDLPGGWRQRLALGCAILHEPPIVFLDEPTGGVDPLSRRRFWDLIGDLSRQGVTVLVTTHYLDEAEHCHRIAIIHAGKLAALGTATELKQVFATRPIVEIQAAQPVQAMAMLDRAADGGEDQPVRHRRPRRAARRGDRRRRRWPRRSTAPGIDGASHRRRSRRRSKTCSSTSSSGVGSRA